MNKRSAHSTPALFRQRFPDAEARRGWLPPLLDALAWIDAGVARCLEDSDREPACRAGCDHCCLNQLIPVTPLEIHGILWFATECLSAGDKERLAERLDGPRQGCPFLLDRRCLIYPLRPVACRQYIVFDRPCAPDEDAWRERRQDVLVPRPEYRLRADRLMLPYHGFGDEQSIRRALKDQELRRRSQLLFACDWSVLLRMLQDGGDGLA